MSLLSAPHFPAPSTKPPMRTLCRWHGGKSQLAPWVISHFGPHNIYVEPFGGAASVLLRKPKARTEILGDLDGDLFEVYEVVRDKKLWPELAFGLMMTPYSRDEFALCYEYSEDRVERVRRYLARQAMGMSANRKNGGKNKTGFRNPVSEHRTAPSHDWCRYVDGLGAITTRLQGVIIENREAIWTMKKYDSPTTLHYADPPYRMDTRRSEGHGYNHELDDAGHDELLKALRELKGMVALSGYPSPAYDAGLPGWQRVETGARDLRGSDRIECLWLNPALQKARAKASRQGDLFA